MKRVFIICPVRDVSQQVEVAISDYVDNLEAADYQVHWPSRDTSQDDPNGIEICKTNRRALFEADEVHVWYDPTSSGSKFDLGMLFAMAINAFIKFTKKVVIINKHEVKPTPHKSFENVLLEKEQGNFFDFTSPRKHEHVCGASGFGHSPDDVCPACEQRERKWKEKRG